MKLTVTELTKKFDSKTVLDSASYTFEKGKIYGLLGRNGAGKTTMFNCFNGNLAPDGGAVTMDADGKPPRRI